MKRIYSTLHFGLILPLVFFSTALCCCAGGEAHATTVELSSHQAMAGKEAPSCCDPKDSNSHSSECNCHKISASTGDVSIKGVSLKPESTTPAISGIDSFVIAFSPSASLSLYHPLSESNRSTPPIYLLNRVFRL